MTGRINPDQMPLLMEEIADLTYLDVRTPREFHSGHMPDAILIPMADIEKKLEDVPEGPLLLLCRSGKRAKAVYDLLLRKGRSPHQLWYFNGYTDYSSSPPRFHD